MTKHTDYITFCLAKSDEIICSLACQKSGGTKPLKGTIETIFGQTSVFDLILNENAVHGSGKCIDNEFPSSSLKDCKDYYPKIKMSSAAILSSGINVKMVVHMLEHQL